MANERIKTNVGWLASSLRCLFLKIIFIMLTVYVNILFQEKENLPPVLNERGIFKHEVEVIISMR